ncbi:MAG: hypothetical protein ACE5DN_00920, partial [Flavobacteriales bacterium]
MKNLTVGNYKYFAGLFLTIISLSARSQNVCVVDPPVSFYGLNSTYCVDGHPSTLYGNNRCAYFTGPGINGNTFDPALAGLGTHTIYYNYDGYGIDQTIPFAPLVGTGTALNLSDDDVDGPYPLGFSFDFFCETYDSFYISSNGFITFNADWTSGCCSGDWIASDWTPNNIIAFNWCDLDPSSGGSADYYTTGTAPNRIFVLNFVGIPTYESNIPSTTQVLLYETSNVIEIHTTSFTYDDEDVTEGLEEMNGMFGHAVPGRNASVWSAFNDAVRFTPNVCLFQDSAIVSVTSGGPAVTISDTCIDFDTVLQYSTSMDTFWITNSGCDTVWLNSITNTLSEYTLSVNAFTNRKVMTDADDAEEDVTNGSMDLTSSDLELVNDGNDQYVGMYLPQGATITDAYVEFECDEALSTLTNLNITGEDVDHAQTFTWNDYDISSRPLTTAAVPWNNLPSWVINVKYQSPDISAVVQEIVNRPGWQNGNSLDIIITGTGHRTAESYNGEPQNAPHLFIKYTTTPLALVSSDSVEVIVTFSPLSAGNYPDTVVINSNTGTDKVCLNGVVNPAPIYCNNPDSFNVTLACDDSITLPLQICNTGLGDLYFTIDSALKPKVASIHRWGSTNSVATAMSSTGLFNSTDFVDFSDPLTLSMSDLAGFDVAFLWNGAGILSSNDMIGDTLKKFVDQGGGVVMATYGLTSNWQFAGDILNPGYSPFIPSAQTAVAGWINLGTVPQPNHPVFNNLAGNPYYWNSGNYSNPPLN